MAMDLKEIEKLIKDELPDALVEIQDLMGRDGRAVDWDKWRKAWTGKFVSKEFNEPL